MSLRDLARFAEFQKLEWEEAHPQPVEPELILCGKCKVLDCQRCETPRSVKNITLDYRMNKQVDVTYSHFCCHNFTIGKRDRFG